MLTPQASQSSTYVPSSLGRDKTGVVLTSSQASFQTNALPFFVSANREHPIPKITNEHLVVRAKPENARPSVVGGPAIQVHRSPWTHSQLPRLKSLGSPGSERSFATISTYMASTSN